MGKYAKSLQGRFKQTSAPLDTWDGLLAIRDNVNAQIQEITLPIVSAQKTLSERGAFKGESVVLIDGILGFIHQAAITFRQTSDRHANKRGIALNASEFDTIRNTGQDYFELFDKLLAETARLVPRLQEIMNQVETNWQPTSMSQLQTETSAALSPVQGSYNIQEGV